MIITRLVGGLGNQMFQYAAGRALAHARQAPLKLDVSYYRNQGQNTPRDYQLGLFNIQEKFVQESDRALLRRWHRRGFYRLNTHFGHHIPALGVRFLTDTQDGFDPRVLQARGSVELDGYWQSEKYFLGAEDILRREFTFKAPPNADNSHMARAMQECASVSLHVRRGDYVHDAKTNALHGTCGLGYYERAVQMMRERVPQARFFVFSDDPEWTRAHLDAGPDTTYVTHNVGTQDHEDLRLMAACKYFIVANSSFSWWGAWLGQYPDKIVIAPEVWSPAATARFHADITPPAWLRVAST